MDTNLKDKKNDSKEFNINLWVLTRGTILIMLILAVISVSLYAPIRNLTIGYKPFSPGYYLPRNSPTGNSIDSSNRSHKCLFADNFHFCSALFPPPKPGNSRSVL